MTIPAPKNLPMPLWLTGLWVFLCAYLNVAGWILSALGELNPGGYFVVFALGLLLMVWAALRRPPGNGISLGKYRRRFSRGFPIGFLLLAIFAIGGGFLHAPNNYDALAYRIPRVYHWLANESWQWIPGLLPRFNTRATGMEWVFAPILLFSKTDRWLFLLSSISFLLMPGLVYALFTGLGVRQRVAWYWMWLVPSGYCFVLQAGGVSNDLFPVPFTLASMVFALRARKTLSLWDFFLSCIAAAMATGAKANHLPLLLPWLIAIFPTLRLLLKRPLVSLLVFGFCFFCSFLPSALLNLKHCGDWSGAKLEMQPAKPVPSLIGNSILILVQNLLPPIVPSTGWWNSRADKLVPGKIGQQLKDNFETRFKLELRELQNEEGAALGMGLTLLVLISLVFRCANSRLQQAQLQQGTDWGSRALLASPYISSLALMMKSNVMATPRLMCAFYILLLPSILVKSNQTTLVRQRWWQGIGMMVFALAALLLVLSPSRPLWPAATVFSRLQAKHPESQLVQRASRVYSVYAGRNQAFAPILEKLPPAARNIGLVAIDEPEASLWRPWGSRRIIHVTPQTTHEALQRMGVSYVILKKEVFQQCFPLPLETWLGQFSGTVVENVPLDLRASKAEGRDWSIIKL